MVERRYFSQQEAEAKVGRRIRTLVTWSGVPKDTTGEVIRADPAGQAKTPLEEPVDTFDVAIQWDLPRDPVQIGAGEVEGEPFIAITGGKPLVDWFTKDEYEQYLVELSEEDET